MDGERDHELTCAVQRARTLLKILDSEHDHQALYAAVYGVKHELEGMARLLPTPPSMLRPRRPARAAPIPLPLE